MEAEVGYDGVRAVFRVDGLDIGYVGWEKKLPIGAGGGEDGGEGPPLLVALDGEDDPQRSAAHRRSSHAGITRFVVGPWVQTTPRV